MHSSRITLGALCAAILILPACGPSYQRKALMPLNEKAAQYEETKNGVTLRARQMNKREADCAFKGRGKYLYSANNPIYPIHVSVANNTAEPISCDPAHTTLTYAHPQEVAQRLQHNTALKTILIAGVGTASIITLGAFLTVFILPIALWSTTALVSGFALWTGILVLTPSASIYYGITWAEDNKHIAHDVCAKTAHCKTENGKVIIAPHDEFSYILFADGKSFKPQFDVTVNNQDTAIIFNVDLEKKQNNS